MRPGGLPASQTAEEVAAVIAEVIKNPVAEVYTNPQHAAVALKYFADVAEFERNAMPSFQPPVVSREP